MGSKLFIDLAMELLSSIPLFTDVEVYSGPHSNLNSLLKWK